MPGNNFHTEIKYLAHAEIDKRKWDNCIYHSINALPYAYSYFLDCMCEKPWDALVWKDYEAVFPLTWNKKAGVFYLYQPHFVQQLGIFSPHKITKELTQDFLSAIPEKFRLVEINVNGKNLFDGNLFSVKQQRNYQLLLNAPHEKVRKGYNENAKRNLKKAEKADLIITGDISAGQLLNLFKQNQGSRIKSIKPGDYTRLKKLIDYAIKNKIGELIAVKNNQQKFCAGGFFIRDEHTIINLVHTSGDEGKKTGASFLLMDTMIKKYGNTGLTFDFEGSEVDSVARFYKGLGGQDVPYWHIRRNNLPWHLKWLKR